MRLPGGARYEWRRRAGPHGFLLMTVGLNAKRLLDWEPRTAWRDGVKRLVDWYVANRSWARQVRTRDGGP